MAPNRWPDEPLPSGIPFADLPITNPNCLNKSCEAFAAGWNESEKEIPLLGQIDYGFWMLCYYLSWLVIFSAAHLVHVLSDYFVQPRRSGSVPRTRWAQKVAACYRSIAYRRFTGRLSKLKMPSYGIVSLFAISTIFTACLVFSERPYLRSRFRYGSPPLSIRCAMCISALMPLLIALAGKVSVVTWLTGASYADLNIFHRYVGGLVFALATTHMVPHLVAPIKDGGYDYLAQLYLSKKRELSGTILYFVFLVMMILSVPWMRRRFYELFAFTHVVLGVAFIGLLWWHIEGEYMSPSYIYATVGILVLSTILRIVRRVRVNPLCVRSWYRALGGFPTTLEPLPGKITKVTVNAPADFRWKPGGHSYIRIPGISLFGNHPFTIASVPSKPTDDSPNQLVFLIRAHAGFTHALSVRCPLLKATGAPTASIVPYPRSHSVSSSHPAPSSSSSSSSSLSLPLAKPSLRTLVDGPYQSYNGPLHATFDTVVLVAAGTGITAALPWALDLSSRMRGGGGSQRDRGRDSCSARNLRLVWVVREEACVDWVRGELDAIVNGRVAAAANDSVVPPASEETKDEEGGVGGEVRMIAVDVYVTAKRNRETHHGDGDGSIAALHTRPSPVLAVPARPAFAAPFSSRTTREKSSQSSPAPSPPPPYHEGSAVHSLSRYTLTEVAEIGERPRSPSQHSVSSYISPELLDAHSMHSSKPTTASSSLAASVSSDIGRSESAAGQDESPIQRSYRETGGVASSLNVRFERPDISKLLPELVLTSGCGTRAIVLGCGPERLKVELGNTVGRLQQAVRKGNMEKVVLHTENFGW